MKAAIKSIEYACIYMNRHLLVFFLLNDMRFAPELTSVVNVEPT